LKRNCAVILLGCTFVLARGAVAPYAAELAVGLNHVDQYTIAGAKHFVRDFEPLNSDGTVNAIVEIPTGTTAKWEVSKSDGQMRWEFQQGKPRIVQYLGYPGNYGMLPQTLLASDKGGDGDPLDVIVLGDAVPRGSVVRAQVVGILKLFDGGEVDDKIIAIHDKSPLAEAFDIDELRTMYPGVLEIVETWFENYKGPGKLIADGYENRAEAIRQIKAAHAEYRRRN